MNVPLEAVVEAVELRIKLKKENIIIDRKNEEFIFYAPEELDTLTEILDSKRVSIRELSERLELKEDQVRLVIDKLVNENKVKGLLIETPTPTFIPDSIIKREREDYERFIERLTTLFSKGEISEESYKTAIKSLEEKMNKLKKEISVPVSEEFVACGKCGHKNRTKIRYCIKCGSELLTAVEIEKEKETRTKAEQTYAALVMLSFVLMFIGLLIAFCMPYPITSEVTMYNPITKRYETISSTITVYGHPFGFVLDGIGFVILLYAILTRPRTR